MAVLRNQIYIGSVEDPSYYFDNDSILSITGNFGIGLAGEELYVDNLLAKVKSDLNLAQIFKPTDYDGFKSSDGKILQGLASADIRKLQYGTPVWYYSYAEDGSRSLVGKFYVEEMRRSGKNTFEIEAVSAIGLLDKQMHTGNYYENVKFSVILADILGNSVSYTINENIQDATLTGWLPYDTKRNNLYQLMLAYNITLLKTAQGDLYFTQMGVTDPISIPDQRIYIGGSFEYPTIPSSVEIAEHTYKNVTSVDDEVLFDNTTDLNPANYKLVKFDNAPIVASSISGSSGLTIHEKSVNHALVSGVGTMTGRPYSHTTNVYELSNTINSNEDYVVSVTDATMVSLLNSDYIARRLLEYYAHAVKIKNAIILEGEKTGGYYQFQSPFGEIAKAFLARMSINVSSNIKADCEMIAEYEPTSTGAIYTHYVLLTAETYAQTGGIWSVPYELLAKENPTFRAILIGGGHGGSSGLKGGSSKAGSSQDNTKPSETAVGGAGGKAGSAGSGGKVLSVTFNTVANQYEYTIGSKGVGGNECGDEKTANEGSDGGATFFAGYSTNLGSAQSIDEGIMNLFTGDIYARKGGSGAAGGKGANYTLDGVITEEAESVTFDGITYYGGSQGSLTAYDYCYATGGKGSGAAVGRNGNGGYSGREEHVPNQNPDQGEINQMIVHMIGGQGAHGVTPIARSAVSTINNKNYGNGGDAGHGGSGAGQGGSAWNENGNIIPWNEAGSGNDGGNGGAGGDGASGAILIYW